jgi:hypothetical protein
MSEANFLVDYLDLEPFAKEVDRDPRTVRRWLNDPDGLPYTRLGNRILIHIPTAREWLFERMHHRTRLHKARARQQDHASAHGEAG